MVIIYSPHLHHKKEQILLLPKAFVGRGGGGAQPRTALSMPQKEGRGGREEWRRKKHGVAWVLQQQRDNQIACEVIVKNFFQPPGATTCLYIFVFHFISIKRVSFKFAKKLASFRMGGYYADKFHPANCYDTLCMHTGIYTGTRTRETKFQVVILQCHSNGLCGICLMCLFIL